MTNESRYTGPTGKDIIGIRRPLKKRGRKPGHKKAERPVYDSPVYEPDYNVYDVTLETGKYRFVRTAAGERAAFRDGDPWDAGRQWLVEQEHSKSFAALMMELQEAREALRIISLARPNIWHTVAGVVRRALVQVAISRALLNARAEPWQR